MSVESSDTSTAQAFEFEPLEHAVRYRHALIGEFKQYLSGNVLEVGAGVGHMTTLLRELPPVKKVIALEPSPEFHPRLRQVLSPEFIVQGTVKDISETNWNSIVCVNVLEHIEHDVQELGEFRERLSRQHGHLCLFVPARQEIYAPIDRDFGHFRRYTRPELSRKLATAGFEVVRLYYFNWVGYFIWWLNFKVMKQRRFDRSKVILFDRVLFPLIHGFESRFLRPPFGQSLLAIGRAKATS